MIFLKAFLPVMVLLTAPAAPVHFRHVRTITCRGTAPEVFLIVDHDIDAGTRPDLGDVRIYERSGVEHPYALRREENAWTVIRSHVVIEQVPRRTIARISVPRGVPVDRVELEVQPLPTGFRRRVVVTSSRAALAQSTVIESPAMGPGARAETVSRAVITIPGERSGKLTLTIENEDDRPLPIQRVRVFSAERRLFFHSSSGLRLFFGDPEVSPPIYDYGKLFTEERDVARAEMGVVTQNPGYRPRDDARPWSERHPSVLWFALVVAVAGLGVLALRQMRI